MLWHFKYDVPWCGPLWVHLVRDSLHFLEFYVFFLHQVREVFDHYRFSILCSLSFPAGILMNWMLLCFMLFQRSLELSSFLKIIIFLFAVLIGCFFLPCLPNYWFDSLLYLTYYLLLPLYYLYEILHSYFWLVFFMVSMSFFMLLSIPDNLTLNPITW